MHGLLQKMRISYKTGGFFRIKRVKWDKDGQMFLDYSILIDSIDDKEKYDVLREIHESQAKEQKDNVAVTKKWIERKNISQNLNGMGRIV